MLWEKEKKNKEEKKLLVLENILRTGRVKQTSRSLAFPFNSSSKSLILFTKFVFSTLKSLIRLLSSCDCARSSATSSFRLCSCACITPLLRCASPKSSRTLAKTSRLAVVPSFERRPAFDLGGSRLDFFPSEDDSMRATRGAGAGSGGTGTGEEARSAARSASRVSEVYLSRQYIKLVP